MGTLPPTAVGATALPPPAPPTTGDDAPPTSTTGDGAPNSPKRYSASMAWFLLGLFSISSRPLLLLVTGDETYMQDVVFFELLRFNVSLGYGNEPARSVQMQIVNALRFNERSRASSLLSDIGRKNIALTANDFVYILEYCARSTDPLEGLRMIIYFPMAIMQPMVSVFEICRVLEYEMLLAHALISTILIVFRLKL
ncbi:hypothetical protein Vadar_023426 [Vaccinium darrowii]|uniref:Uncharacterized protein n=1 Tax=Vaccinium darrowii TaxID=229202 RepID=A0ACB7XTZ5_9ERIC|nr:hypothetical protein Vadar_023426 [Vaccinium darrowii]